MHQEMEMVLMAMDKGVDMRVEPWIISMKISTIRPRSLRGKSLELTVSERRATGYGGTYIERGVEGINSVI